VVNSVLKTVDQTTVSNNNVGFNDEKPTILVSEKLGEAGLQVLRQLGNVECAYDLSPEDLCKKISSCDALIVRSGTKVTRQVFEAGKGKLKVVGRAGVGIDNVDLQAATEFGCLVVNAPTANTIAAAEHGIALLAAMARNVSQADASLKAGTNNTCLSLILNIDSLLSSSIHAFTNCLISIVWMRGIYDQRESRFIH
jgi:D-3-phosphoglycerate dehydrogenase